MRLWPMIPVLAAIGFGAMLLSENGELQRTQRELAKAKEAQQRAEGEIAQRDRFFKPPPPVKSALQELLASNTPAAQKIVQQLASQCAQEKKGPSCDALCEADTAKCPSDEAAAAALAKSAYKRLVSRDFNGAISDANLALAKKPTARATLAYAYRSLGYGSAYLGNKDDASVWLIKYLDYCDSDCAVVKQFLGTH